MIYHGGPGVLLVPDTGETHNTSIACTLKYKLLIRKALLMVIVILAEVKVGTLHPIRISQQILS